MADIRSLLVVADAYCEAKNIAPSTLSNKLFNDGKRLGDLHRGKDLHSRRLHGALVWLSRNWPDEKAPWPDGIERPGSINEAAE